MAKVGLAWAFCLHLVLVLTTAPAVESLTLGPVVPSAAAGAILILFWLPAEYGIDPTGMGRLTGLTEMGEIKQMMNFDLHGNGGDYQELRVAKDERRGQMDLAPWPHLPMFTLTSGCLATG
ncbi:MAG TPA: hypothetical protein VK146_04505 [Tabrizicola sp.]|nr:hypothetical protein [Tabrizicola sp.]